MNSGLPIPAASLTPGKVTTSWYTVEPHVGAYDVAYDIMFNQTPATSESPDGAEVMVWLDHNGSVQPAGSIIASNVTIGALTFNVWYEPRVDGGDISYELTTPRSSVSNLDIGEITADSIRRGYVKNTWYLVDIEAGFELWTGGKGLITKAFTVNVNGYSDSATNRPGPGAAMTKGEPK